MLHSKYATAIVAIWPIHTRLKLIWGPWSLLIWPGLVVGR